MCINGKLISVKKKNSDIRQQIVTNCGKCHICHSQRAMSWAVRCTTEYEQNPNGCYFITLTYNDENLSEAPDKKEIARFHKSLRKLYERRTNGQNKFKFFLVSEYGYETERLHYHAVYFGLPYTNDDTYISISNDIAKVWKKGFVDVRPFDVSKVLYCLKYLHKDKELGNIQVFSKNLGKISKDMIKYMNTTTNFENIKMRINQRNVSMPRYFRKKYMTEEQKEAFGQHFIEKSVKEKGTGLYLKKMYNFEQSERRFKDKK